MWRCVLSGVCTIYNHCERVTVPALYLVLRSERSRSWQLADTWQPCAIGALPSAFDPSGMPIRWDMAVSASQPVTQLDPVVLETADGIPTVTACTAGQAGVQMAANPPSPTMVSATGPAFSFQEGTHTVVSDTQPAVEPAVALQNEPRPLFEPVINLW